MSIDPAGGPSSRLYRALSSHRRAVALGAYAVATGLAFTAAYLLRFEFRIPPEHVRTFLPALLLLLLVRGVCDAAFRITAGRWRFAGVRDAVRLAGSTVAGSAVFWLVLQLVGFQPAVPRSVLLIELVLSANAKTALWIVYRLWVARQIRRSGKQSAEIPALIVGAGSAGGRLAREMMAGGTGYAPVGFVDDDPLMMGTRIEGIPVLGRIEDIAALAGERGARTAIVAMPSAPARILREVVQRTQEAGLPVKILPAMAAVLEGEASIRQLREVRIEDLLGREPVHLELPELALDLEGRTVLITGAAGSMGQGLARQVALHRPRRLVLLDQAESPLYFVELELRERHPDLDLVPVVGDILDRRGMARVYRRHRPERVFHAAAYKHVPLMECNPVEAVRNNVVGTLRMAELAGQVGAERFVLISTDKAVDPSSVMGATKRLAEMILLGARGRYPDTWFTAVRFGNVLGSQGSVIPLFRRQLETTRRLTVTHPDVTRYFMTIPEAVQLVLQASVLEEGRGRIAMLEMGEPVKIVELARNLIRLAGLREGIDAQIVFTGLRPGEKMHEVLTGDGEDSFETRVARVRVVGENGRSPSGMTVGFLDELEVLDGKLHQLDPGRVRAEVRRLMEWDGRGARVVPLQPPASNGDRTGRGEPPPAPRLLGAD